MSYSNGRLPDSALAPIPGGRLRRDAAAAWNAMCDEAQRRYHVALRPLGPQSSYRTLSEQYWLWDHVAHPHDTNWVARPGTSNHGWGLAVDLGSRQMRWVIDQIGMRYGWAKAWSDAPVEWWHIRYREGIWHPGPSRAQLETRALSSLGRLQRKAARTLLYRRRRRAREGRTGEGPRWRRWDRLVRRSYRRVERLHRRASGHRRTVLQRVLSDRNGYLTT